MSGTCAFPLRLLLAAALVGCAGLPLPGQQDSSSQAAEPAERSNLVFRKNVHRVILDVVVTDSNEKAVRGLTRDDFSITEDGKTQRVLSFDVHDFDTPPEVPPKVPPLPPNTFMNVPAAEEQGPLNVILYDMVNMKVDDQPAARQQLLKFITNKPHGSRFAIFVLSDGLRMVQGFTESRTELFAAMDPKSPKPHVPRIFLQGANYGQGEIRLIRWAFTQVAHFLDGLPGRKNVIWLTGSVPTSILPTSDPTSDPLSYNDEIKEMTDALARSQVAVYPVDVRGVVVVAKSTSPQAGPGGTAMVTTSDNPNLIESYLTEGDIASATGGHAFFSNNDVTDILEQATETGGSYYTLTYSPSNQNYDGQMRKLHVELAKRGYHLAYRHAYYAFNPDLPHSHENHQDSDPAQRGAPGDSLFANMQHGAPLVHQLLFKVHIRPVGIPARATPAQMSSLAQQPDYFRARRKNHVPKPLLPIQLQTYAIDYIVVVDRPKAVRVQPFTMEVAAAAFDGEGVMLNGMVESAAEATTTSPGEGLQATSAATEEASTRRFHRAQQLIDVPLNATSIRLAVRDTSTDRIGAMEVSLPLAPEPETQADAPIAPSQPSSPEAAQPKMN